MELIWDDRDLSYVWLQFLVHWSFFPILLVKPYRCQHNQLSDLELRTYILVIQITAVTPNVSDEIP